MPQRLLVILANSIKNGQCCVAGKCIVTKEWIRLVSDHNGAELSREQAKSTNPHGRFRVKPLQKTRVGISEHAPLINQPENHIIDNSPWTQAYKIDKRDLDQYLDNPESLWGVGDRVDYEDIEDSIVNIDQSLYLVKVNNLRLYKNDDLRRRASFNYRYLQYDLAVTDPNFDQLNETSSNQLGILCISLGEPFRGDCYKIVASIF